MPSRLPEAQHQIQLGPRTITYSLRRSSRRSIGLAIDQRGLRVGAPVRARLSDIETLIRQHADWVLDKLTHWANRPQPATTPLHDGALIPVFGLPTPLHLTQGKRASGRLEGGQLHLTTSPTVDAPQALESVLKAHARQVLHGLLAEHAARLGVPTPPLRLSSARTRWGSCNSRSHIALNWRLVFLPLPTAVYVVCHELAHLKEMNHSPRFWSVVAALCPDWQAQRLALRQLGGQLPIYA